MNPNLRACIANVAARLAGQSTNSTVYDRTQGKHIHVSGKVGQCIDVSMLEGQLSLLNVMLSTYLANSQVPGPTGTAYKAIRPYQTFHTATRGIAIAVGSANARGSWPLRRYRDRRPNSAPFRVSPAWRRVRDGPNQCPARIVRLSGLSFNPGAP